MAKFDVTLSAVTAAASNIKKYSDEFKEHAKLTYQAAQNLGEGWEGDSYQTFIDNMGQLNNWLSQMAQTLDTYAVALEKVRETYETADRTATGSWK